VKSIRHTLLTSLVVAGLLTSGCGSQSSESASPARMKDVATSTAAQAVAPKVTKLLVFVEENHSMTQMRDGMPYTFGLAKKYGYATRYFAMTHPSLPNYIAMAGGRTYGISDDADPSAHPIKGRSVFGQALAQGRTAGLYAQSMPTRCATTPSAPYAVKHNPWAYFVNERRGCRAHDLPMKRFAAHVAAGELPRVGMVIPDLDHDAHDGTLHSADRWFKRTMSKVFAGPDWQSGHLAVVLTADEDDSAHDNRVLTVVIHGSQHHHVVKRRLSHYSLTRLYDDVADLPYLNRAKDAVSMTRAFGLPVR
jgi:acid phosphatase